MKLLTAQQIKDWDRFTIQHGGITSIELMERAASLCAEKILLLMDHLPAVEAVYVFCGPGNNGGDGLVIARKLAEQGKKISVFLLDGNKQVTPDFATNLELLPVTVSVNSINMESEIPVIRCGTLIIDAIYGTGLNRAPEGLAAQTIDTLNKSGSFIIAIDVPSGLPTEIMDVEMLSNRSVIEADLTYTFQVPKLSFLHAECYQYTGDMEAIEIGLLPDFLESVESDYLLITTASVQSFYKQRLKFSHKGIFGHALIVAGSYGKLGAAILSSKAALRTGCGLVTAFVPKVGFAVLQTSLPEVMVTTDDELFEIRNFPETTSYAAIGVGPGLGTHPYTEKGFSSWLKQVHQPVVIDADGLNLCASLMKQTADFYFPQNCIITPHPTEFDRLAGASHTTFERRQKQQAFAKQYGVVVVLKGAHTGIALPDGRFWYNCSGNVALATAGSGDVLTGIITALLAQQYSPEEAALMGVYLHGICADNWVDRQNQTMIAGDIIEMIPHVLYRLFN